jgi:hypothetical protein
MNIINLVTQKEMHLVDHKKVIFLTKLLATRNLGLCYESGRGIELDGNEAFKLYQEAVKRNNYFGKYNNK